MTYDIGVALTFLKTKDVIRVLGRKSFAEVCETDAGLSDWIPSVACLGSAQHVE